MRAGRNFTGNTFRHSDSGLLERKDFIWIVRQQAYMHHPERFQNFRRQCKLPVIGLEPQPFVGLDRVQAGILQFISLQLGHQSNPAPLLLLIDQDSCTLARNHRKRQLELLSAIAAQRTKNISRKTLRMYSDQGSRRVNVTHDEGDSFLWLAVLHRTQLKAVYTEMPPPGRKISGG